MTEQPRQPRSSASSGGPLSASLILDQLRELDDFEHDLAANLPLHAPARLHINMPTRAAKPAYRLWASLGGLAVAASLLVVFVLNQHPKPVDPLGGSTIADLPLPKGSNQHLPSPHIADASPAADPHASVLLTIVEGSDPATGLPCASCRTVDLVATDGKEQTLLAHAEPVVIQDAMNRTCSPSARRVVVVGLSGPTKALPKTEAQATQLAQCIMTAPGASSPGGDADVISSAASACMPESVSVRVWAASR